MSIKYTNYKAVLEDGDFVVRIHYCAGSMKEAKEIAMKHSINGSIKYKSITVTLEK